MKRICAWCKTELEVSRASAFDEAPIENAPISHGLCPECAFHVRSSMGMQVQEFLDGLGAPVVLVDEDAKVVCANAQARDMLGKDASRIDGFKGGEVFECEYAYLPEGCGNTVHCSGCTVRLTVMDTLNTGRSHDRVPAFLNQRNVGKISLLISTEKVEDAVLLRIDDVTR